MDAAYLHALGEEELQLMEEAIRLNKTGRSPKHLGVGTVLPVGSERRHPDYCEAWQPVFAAHAAIHTAYAEEAHCDDEALKRALFLQWYVLVEPPDFTGLGWVEETSTDLVWMALERRLRSQRLDRELEVMLHYMFGGWTSEFKYLLESLNRTPLLRLLESKVTDPDLPVWNELDAASMEERGQMGDYFASVLEPRPGEAKGGFPEEDPGGEPGGAGA